MGNINLTDIVVTDFLSIVQMLSIYKVFGFCVYYFIFGLVISHALTYLEGMCSFRFYFIFPERYTLPLSENIFSYIKKNAKAFFLQIPNYAISVEEHADLDIPWILSEVAMN